MCLQTHVARVSRHDRVTALLSSALEKRHYKCFLEPYISKRTDILKPDIISSREGSAVVIDTQIISDLSLMGGRYDQKMQNHQNHLTCRQRTCDQS